MNCWAIIMKSLRDKTCFRWGELIGSVAKLGSVVRCGSCKEQGDAL